MSTGEALSPRILHSGEGIAIAEVGPVCVVIWRQDVNRRRFELQRAGLAAVVSRHRGRAGLLCVIEPTCPPPSDEFRRESPELVDSHMADLKCVACVIEGTGFKAALGRSILAGMALLLRRKSAPVAHFATVERAAPWMSRYMGVELPPSFHKAVESVRASLD